MVIEIQGLSGKRIKSVDQEISSWRIEIFRWCQGTTSNVSILRFWGERSQSSNA